MQTFKTYCRNCQSACGMGADVEDGRIIAIRGDRDHPMSAGYSCIKGQYSKALHGGEDRLVRVLRRNSLTSHLISPVEDIEAINFMSLQSGVRVRIGQGIDPV